MDLKSRINDAREALRAAEAARDAASDRCATLRAELDAARCRHESLVECFTACARREDTARIKLRTLEELEVALRTSAHAEGRS